MSRVVQQGGAAALLIGPTVLAFFSGGYFDGPRVWAGLIAWLLVAVAMVAVPRPLPRTLGARLAIVGLLLLAIWTVVSFTWAPVAGSAYHAGQRVVLYAGILIAASVLLRERGVQRAVEPALAAGILIVIGYGLSERFLPGLLHFTRSISAQGRLEQPLTYWNAMGELAAIGFVLCARIAGDATRSRRLRIAASAAASPIGMGLYISFSRGALFACLAGLVALTVLAPRREQLRGTVLTVAAGVLASSAAAPFKGVTSLGGALSSREREGAIALALLVVIMAAAALMQWRMTRSERPAELSLPQRAPLIALTLICAGLAAAIVIGAKEKASQQLSPGATRLITLQSNRYAYWDVALRAFDDQPIRGVGAGGWAVYWLRYRTVTEFAQDAHSLPLQTLAELGVIGVLLLLAFFGGVGLAARDAVRSGSALAAGPVAGFVAYVAHAPLDWDWQMPALTIVALILAGHVLAAAEEPAEREAETTSTAPPRSAALPA